MTEELIMAIRRKRTGTGRPAPAAVAIPPSGSQQVYEIKSSVAEDLLRRLDAGTGRHVPSRALAVPGAPPAPTSSVEDRWNAALGCKTSEVALKLLAQLVALEHHDKPAGNQAETALMQATAMVAELEPETATQAMLAAQMVGAHRAVMIFLYRATLPGQTFDGTDANVQRAARLMRLFTEQADTMLRLKGKGGQQRVVVERVTVADGGQAIVGAVQGGTGGQS
jgi:hypothetical protein